ncbi:hypothetical protein J5226_09810 [Lysobacter sp. K5869]|uniref:hypothetical protein n=1 Tax=Lysobacter sp. K5869 TaxID=2820808 RepID=UPI001C062F43|nr:hypothetical protein [Lysobacter sp. K5869]QWP78661.1 hypothetical protein J5226_09810 [Lysobacter sp. K5869]
MTHSVQRTALFLSLCLAAACGAVSFDARAGDGCGERSYDLLLAAYPGAQSETGDDGEFLRTAGSPQRWIKLDDVACKVWPASPDKTLLAVRLRHDQASGEVDVADLEVLVADSAKPRILQRYRENDALTSDAVRISSVTLDTARYRLDDKTTAFGVRVTYSGSSRVNPYESTVLALYVGDGAKLRPVLSNLEVALDRGEWDGNCAGEFETVQRTVAIDAKRDHGFAGLLVNSVSQARRNSSRNDDCEDISAPKRKSSDRLPFDGQRYVVPSALRAL